MMYRTPGTSRIKLRQKTKEFREQTQVKDLRCIPIVRILETLPHVFNGWNYEVVDDWKLPKCHAKTIIDEKTVLLRQSVYDGACLKSGRDRMTIAHEIAHVAIHGQNPLALNRDFDQDRPIRAFEDPEWQAKCWSGELMMPKEYVEGWDVLDIVEICGVSREAAEYQKKKWKEERGKRKGTKSRSTI